MAATTPVRSRADITRELFTAIFDRGDLEAARPYWSEDTVDHFLALGLDARGPDELTRFFTELRTAIPDLQVTVENVIENGPHAVVQWTLDGTFDGGPFQGIEATGSRVHLRGCDVFRWTDDDKIDTNTIYYDASEFARQIGMLPPRDSRADRATLAAFNAATRARRRLRARRRAATA